MRAAPCTSNHSKQLNTALEQKTGDYITRKELDPHTLHKIDLPAVVRLGKAVKMKLTRGEGR